MGKLRQFLFSVSSVLFFAGFVRGEPERRFSFREEQMGTLMEIILYAEDEAVAEEAARGAFGRIAELNGILSDYDSGSEAMRLVRRPAGEPYRVSEDLFFVLKKADFLSERTDGVFDVTVGPLSELWRNSRKERRLPEPEVLEEARGRVGYRFVKLESGSGLGLVTLLRSGMRFDFGGIAKGYAADEAVRVLGKSGFSRVLVAAAGDIVVGDPPPGEDGWRIGIESFGRGRIDGESLILANRAVSTSGDTEQFVEIGGVRYSHILNPKTGLGLTERISVTVVAERGIDSDSIATAVSLLGVEKGLELVEGFDGVEVRIDALVEGEIRTFKTERFPVNRF